jgi:hypothetical protein
MLALSASDNGWSAISPENRDPLFRITPKNLEYRHPFPKFANARSRHTLQKLQIGGTGWAPGAQKGSPAKRTGHTLLVAAQYSQELPENNALFAIWLAD